MFRSAERTFASVAESLECHNSEGQKLLQRMAAAEEQYDTGLRKLVATAKQLTALQKRVRGSSLLPILSCFDVDYVYVERLS